MASENLSSNCSSTEIERDVLMRRARARTPSPRRFMLLEHSFQPTPSPLCGLAWWPLLGVLLHESRRVTLDLT